MKKLEKLTLKEMSNQMNVFDRYELPLIIGGSCDTVFVTNYVWGELQSAFSPITNGVTEVINGINSAANGAVNWATEHHIPEIALAIGACAADIYLWWCHGATPIQGQDFSNGAGSGSGSTSTIGYMLTK